MSKPAKKKEARSGAHKPGEMDWCPVCKAQRGHMRDLELAVVKAAMAWDEQYTIHKSDCPCRLCIDLGRAVESLRAARSKTR